MNANICVGLLKFPVFDCFFPLMFMLCLVGQHNVQGVKHTWEPRTDGQDDTQYTFSTETSSGEDSDWWQKDS